jgi:hypothetical protein
MKSPGDFTTGRITCYCLPSVIRMSSISSFRLRAFMVFSFARTTSVFTRRGNLQIEALTRRSEHHAAVGINHGAAHRTVDAQQRSE